MTLKKRIEALEMKINCNQEDLPSCIIIQAQGGRLDAVEDETPIMQFHSGNVTYFLEPGETEILFTARAAKAAKNLLPSKMAVPCLMATTSKMLAEKAM
ncbi:hypothetical protein [Desulfobacula sp.]|uniref:hypothetical protein n=1 Tax=Desulfobacula sp. TaxID=2593537 RepID=UPI00261577AC|nr:hypothetical protein [Desulfobacula sp.]